MSDFRYPDPAISVNPRTGVRTHADAIQHVTPGEHLPNADSDAGYARQSVGEQQKNTVARGMQTLHKGTPYVKKTAPAMLERGEAVIPKDKNPNNPAAKMFDKMSGKSSYIKLKKAASGGYIATHVTEPSDGRGEEHVLPDMVAVHNHIEEHLGTPNEGEQVEGQEQ